MTPQQGNGDPAPERRAPEDLAVGSREMEEKATSRTSQDAPQPLSDSENEEPFPRRTSYRSAFVSKTNPNPFTSLSWSLQSRLERSQSCSDHVTESLPPAQGRRRPQPQKTKVFPGVGGLGVFTGVLLSTENSRSFSAPVLTSERRVTITALNSFTPLHKPERSISPESNDSISEELNHFKPIVCSPCTPPKRLPDGQVLSPVIIKSTPRNLRRNLQKPTSYEASPVILKKWEQVFKDRQMKRTLSKGTLTTPAEEGSIGTTAKKVADLQAKPGADPGLVPSSSQEAALVTPPLACSGCLHGKDPRPEPVTDKDFLEVGTKTRLAARLTSNKKTIPQCKCLLAKPMKPPALKRAPKKKNAQPMGLPNGTGFAAATAAVENIGYPPQRRGQKRRCKTKHLERNGAFKRLRVTCRAGGGAGQGGFERIWRETEKKLRQEEEDKKLALKLQKMFDKERRMVKRCKSSRDEYPLRSKSTAGAT
ncbi:E3 ubiquitin-protein ligase RNF169 isoform X2 [Hyla sarda]|uniref:E3 ubiquitin-protein ligase RNF169 isoform X2 n=1 Tax=Hyla sarda TaxID=327740 RepID=UPI0024C24C80|nr:E3 ubiquitin-protein ligase RNF169 isoform X2 [Hyla sarda]